MTILLIINKIPTKYMCIGTVVALLLGFVFSSSIAWTSLAGVCVLAVCEAVLVPNGDASRLLKHADGFLLVMIAALMVVIAGARATGVPVVLYEKFSTLAPLVFDTDFDEFPDVLAVCMLVAILSNLCSNVPTVMLIAPRIAEVTNVDGKYLRLGWLALAFSSTIAGNFTLVGSISNLIVAEKAANVKNTSSSSDQKERELEEGEDTDMSCLKHFKYGGWSTLLFLVVGSAALFYSA